MTQNRALLLNGSIRVYVNYTHLYNWSPPPCYLTTDVLNDCYSEVMAYTALAYSYWASFHNAYGFLPHTIMIPTAAAIQKP